MNCGRFRGLPVCRFCLLVAGIGALALSAGADVFQDALIWRQGAKELDPNGQHAVVEEDMVSAWSGHTNRYPVLRLNQETTESIQFSLSELLSTNITMMTVHVRCKWDGDFLPNLNNRAYLLSYGNGWGEYRGSSFSFIPMEGTSGSVRFDNGREQGAKTTPVIETNVWYDVFYTLQDPLPSASAANHNVYIHAYLIKDVGKRVDADDSGHYSSWRSSGNYRSAEMKPTDTLTIGNQFKGSIAQVGFWDRILTISEMAEVSAQPGITPDLIRIGKADGSNAEFASDLTKALSTVTMPSVRWDRMPSELNADFPELKVNFREKGYGVYDKSFDRYSYTATLDNVLTIKTTPDSGISEVEVFLDEETAKSRRIRSPRLYPGEATMVWVPGLSIGDHTLTIRRKSGTVKLDFVQLGGSWTIGDFVYVIATPWTQYNGGQLSTYALVTDTPREMGGGVVAEGNPNSGASVTVKFNLTPEMATLAYTYEIATGQALNNVAPNLIVYVNGVEFTRKTAAYQYGNISLSFPAGTFRAGENKIVWRYDTSKHASNYWVGIRAHRFHVVKDSLPKYGLMLIVR